MIDPDVLASLTPAQIVGVTLYGEARGSSPALREGIASVITNRVAAQREAWGLTPAAVCLAHGQFSCWSPAGGDANYRVVMVAADLLAAGMPMLAAPLRACLALGTAVADGVWVDTVHGATHYYSPAAMVPKNQVPAWAAGLEPVAVIDSTRFYKGVK